MNRRRAKKESRRYGFNLTPRLLLKVALYFLAGVVYVVWVYITVEKRGSYHTLYEFYHTVQTYLLPVWALGLLTVLYIYAVSGKIIYLSVTVLTVLAAWYSFDKPLHKHLVVVNVSDQNRSVQIDGESYLIEPGGKSEFLFSRRNIAVDNELLEKKGCYLVNTSYPQRYVRYSSDQNFQYKDVNFNTLGPWSLSRTKITHLDDNPRAVVQLVCGQAWKNSIAYCVKGADSQKAEP